MEILIYIWYSPVFFCHNFSLQVYTVPFQWRLLIFIGKNLWRRVLEANTKQVPLKSYSLEIRIDSNNQILKNKEKVTQTCNLNIYTDKNYRPEDSVCVYSCLSNNRNLRTWPGLYNTVHHADNRKYFLGLSLIQNWREAHMFYLARKVGKNSTCSCWEKGNVRMINEFKYG